MTTFMLNHPPMKIPRFLHALFLLGLVALTMVQLHATAPVVSNVRASQRPGSGLVDIYYDLADADGNSCTITVAVSLDGGASYTSPAKSFSGSGLGANIAPGASRYIQWNAGADLSPQLFSRVRVRVTAEDTPAAPSGMVLIPAGSFQMGDTFNDSDASWGERPVHTVYVSTFYMDRYEVTKELWDSVKVWNGGNGYSYDNTGSGKAANHPVHTVNWFDTVKWCNARSQKDGLTPVYYTDAALTMVYKTGQVSPYVKWTANGYRLPTEAEWEKAARGGVSGHRFPWSQSDNITHSLANYYSSSSDAYDTSPTRGYHPNYATGGYPYTSPVGSFAVNGYGLCDMAGNVWEWCWDWWDSGWYGNAGATQNDSRGPAGPLSFDEFRVLRAGSWYSDAIHTRCALRIIDLTPSNASSDGGFRCVRGG
jgi:formylglycine-generating enzyme required for sulfatase activity